MSSSMFGTVTSEPEVTNISPHGFWLLLNGEELFLPYGEFPWFQDATVRELTHVELPGTNHLYWPELDVDLSVDSIRHPEKYPLRARHPTIET